MALATKRPSSPSPAPSPAHAPARHGILALLETIFDAVYRFLGSLKLAVFTLATVAAVLAVGTYVESRYGTSAVQQWVYRSWWFAIVLAFLGTNILCAALIRFPWTKRQTGFVITHAGLLTVLAGSFWSLQTAEEGQVALQEGDKTDQLVRPDHPVIRLREVDPHSRKPLQDFEYSMSFFPGARAWGPGRYEVVSDVKDPFKLAVKGHLTASSPHYLHEPVPTGSPMIKVALFTKTPNRMRESDLFEEDTMEGESWLIADNRGLRAAKRIGAMPENPGGVALLAFQYLDSEGAADAFLHPPDKLGTDGVALIHYKDKAGRTRVEPWPIDPQQAGQIRELPGSDYRVSFEEVTQLPPDRGVESMTGDPEVELAMFKVRQGNGEPVSHFGWAWLPMLPSVVPTSRKDGANESGELVHIDFLAPLSPRRMGMVEVAALPDGRLLFRAFNRQGLKGAGELKVGDRVPVLGGGNMPMSISLRVEKFLKSGRERLSFEQIELPVGKLETGIPAALAELSVDGETKEFWLRRTGSFEPNFKMIVMPSGRAFELAYDIDRKPLGFEIKLDNFDVGFDPGTSEPASFQSDIRLTDEAQGVKDKPISIWMNHTMTHRDLTFYQSNYIPVPDKRTGEPSGEYMSVFQVVRDPGRPLKYIGCLLVALGAFVQFYMRAGLFSDGGKRERALAAAKAARLSQKNNTTFREDGGGDLEAL